MSLQNLREDYLYDKLPEGIITLDEQSILRALVGGIQDRLEDIRSYAKKYEVLFSAEGMANTIVLVTFETSYGKVVTRSLDIQDDTPEEEGAALTAWATDQLGLDESQITSCVLGEDLLRFVDTNTLQYLAATIGAVLYQTASQSGIEELNQQRILNSYFPRLKIKGTAMSFDILGKLIGFDDVRMTPLWSRLSPRVPNDVGDAANDQDFAETPTYYPQQMTGVAYDPHVFRDGPYYTWVGTVSADPTSTNFYTQTVNGFQPWIKVAVTGSVVHPAIGDSISLAGGSPHTKASVDAGQGLTFQALGEGEDFNGLQVTFETWNSGTDRLVSITDRLSTIKYRTSYFDLALTLTDEHAIQQFGTTTAKPNADLQANPTLAEGRTAASPFRPWRGGEGDVHAVFQDFVWVSSGTTTPLSQRSQATTSLLQTQFKTDDIQAAGQEAVQITEEVRAATRFPRRSSIGFLNRDDVDYASIKNHSVLFDMENGVSSYNGYAHDRPKSSHSMELHAENLQQVEVIFNDTAPGFTYTVNFFFSAYPVVVVSAVSTGGTLILRSPIYRTDWFAITFPASPTPYSAIINVSADNIILIPSYDPYDNNILLYKDDNVSARYFLSNGSYVVDTLLVGTAPRFSAYWTPLDTEVVRSDPFATPTTQVFAAFGDSTNNNNTYMVGTLVASWQPDFLLMLGDLNYTVDPAQYANENRPFLPWINDGKVIAVPGNHDLDIQNGAAFYNFFKQNKRFLDRRIGNVHVFAIDDGYNTVENVIYPDGNSSTSLTAIALRDAMSVSQAPWKVVMIHHDPYTSANTGHGAYPVLRWPYKEWGADVVLFGHVHAFEHLYVTDSTTGNNGVHFLDLGFGGKDLKSFNAVGASSYSVTRYPVTPAVPHPGAARFTVTATTFTWDVYTVDGVLRETFTLTKAATASIYQVRPEDETGEEGSFEVFDEVPWRRDLIGNGELVELVNRTPPVIDDVSLTNVSEKIAVKDQTGADYTVHGLNSTVNPIRLSAEINATDKSYVPGQLAIAYKGDFVDLLSVPPKRLDIVPGFFTDIESYGTYGFRLYHAGLVQGVLVSDPVSFYGPHHRNGLKLWLPMNEHPDEGAVVSDRSVSGVDPTLSGFTLQGSFADRLWDDSFGWHLYVKDATVEGSGIREVGPDYSLSMWVNPDAASGTVAQTLFNQGPLTVYLSGTDNVAGITYDNKNGSTSPVSTFVLTPGTFCQIAVSVDGNYLSYGLADKATSLSLSTGTLGADYQPFNGTHTDFLIDCPDRGVRFSDIRVWNRSKTQAELEKVRDYQPVPTVCTYWPTNIEIAGNRDRYGLRVLDTGFITPDVMPPAIRLNQLARVIRYTDEGRYEGENRFNEVGLGGGTPLPPQWQLGQQFYEMTSTGTVAFCTSWGGVPFNPFWQYAGDDAYVGLNFSGSTATGIPATGTAYPSTPWPPPMEFNNPAHEFIWIKGDDRKVYEVSLHSSTGTTAVMVGSLVVRERSDAELVLNGALQIVTAGPATPHDSWDVTGTAWVTFDNGTFNPAQVLIETDGTYTASFSTASKGVAVLTNGTGEVKVYHPQAFRFVEEPTGAQSILVTNGTELTCNYGGFVYQRYTGGTLSTPPLYMYLTARTLEDTSTSSSAWERWTDHTDASLYGNTLTPPMPALDESGVMEFENTSDLAPGHYRLTIESGCIGRVDEDFDGFSVFMTIDTVLLEKRLQVGQTGADFRGTDVFEFDYNNYNTEDWLLTVQYLNALTDVDRGTQRNLVIYNYKLERIETDLYAVTIGAGPAPDITQVQTGTYTGTNPGGWLAILNSYGTIVNVVHESNVFPSNDTVTSVVPLSSMLTSNTWQRREDHYAAASSLSVLPDDAVVAMPTFGGIIVQ